ncbi:uncharacterized protein LOC121727543 [Aricia agestis]|uniref:uncharacterized protein LOC121727543 n=1 Tax=Aricia agestis TaxID=91739 RepID=UPI001C209020|nr:uncharacterized protein LOC121727543 [Aricia agestis]
MDPQELEPLESGIPRPRPSRQISTGARSCYRGPIRLCRLLALVIMLPCVFIFVPLYMRYRVFSGQMYPMSMTDMRLIDSKISPTWCQKQVVKSNTTFNAFVVPGPPELVDELVPVSMTRELVLEDDMKEYWGFYLLQGSTVTVSACVSFPGASLIMIKGYKHLQECAYIGDDSSEEVDELYEANKLGLLNDTMLIQKLQQLKKTDGKANRPETMKRHKAGVSFHDPDQSTNATSSDNMPSADIADHDSKELKQILEKLHAIQEAAKTEKFKHYHPPSHLMSLPALHRHRDTNVDKDQRKWISFKDLDGNISEPVSNNDTFKHLEPASEANNKITLKANTKTVSLDVGNNRKEHTGNIDESESKVDDITTHVLQKEKVDETNTLELNFTTISNDSYVNSDAITNTDDKNNEELSNSKEVFEDVLQRLRSLGDRGKRVLVKLHESLGMEYTEEKPIPGTPKLNVTGSDEELKRLRNILVEAINEEQTKVERHQKRSESMKDARTKRELLLQQAALEKELNEDDGARDYAAEEGLDPDGYAEHHVHLNETTAFDMSNSEFWSSFSSSEEALLECAGLILNLPLRPHPSCKAGAPEADTKAAARTNALTYRVPSNGYYFFIFNSENEVQKNFIRARFDLQKTRYDVARTALRECTNSTERCALPLDLFSSQKVVLEVPLRNNASLWNEHFLVTSECEPRTSVYLTCVIAVPLIILIFAFQ